MTSNELVKNAKKYLGKPYVWGGESDEEGGYDCSGFVFCALRDSGFKTSRLTAQGFSKLGITCPNICKGDLLFFGNPISHVAIAVNSHEMIESIGSSKNTKNNKGKGVTISEINRRKDLVLIKRLYENSKEVVNLGLLKKGTASTDVTLFEIFMAKLGYYKGNIDTIYGSGCVKACKSYQSDRGLTADGQCGYNTWSAIYKDMGTWLNG